MAEPFIGKRPNLKDVAETLTDYLGVDKSESNLGHLVVLLEAFYIYVERNSDHHDLWRMFGWEDSALHIRSKAARVGLVLRADLDVEPDRVLREIPDLINYSVFFDRNVTGR